MAVSVRGAVLAELEEGEGGAHSPGSRGFGSPLQPPPLQPLRTAAHGRPSARAAAAAPTAQSVGARSSGVVLPPRVTLPAVRSPRTCLRRRPVLPHMLWPDGRVCAGARGWTSPAPPSAASHPSSHTVLASPVCPHPLCCGWAAVRSAPVPRGGCGSGCAAVLPSEWYPSGLE